MYCVQVSARILSFPRYCCSCGCSGPTERYHATATRTTGKKVIKTDTRSWEFPICRSCSHWIAQQQAANALFTWAVILAVVSILAFVSGLVVITSAVAGGLGILLGIGSGIAVPFVFRSWRRQQAEADRVKPTPDSVLEPVTYSGWSGSVHTFYFSSQFYCAQFQRANAKKLLG